MLVLKFGGTSVGSAQRMREVFAILNTSTEPQLVVLSAMAGTTNALVEINAVLREHKEDIAQTMLDGLKQHYNQVCHELFPDQPKFQEQACQIVKEIFGYLAERVVQSSRRDVSKEVLSQGEILSTHLFHLLVASEGKQSALLPALDFMRLDEKSEPFLEKTSALLKPILSEAGDVALLITQGYICRNHWGEIDNLQRGGSDYTATILGAVLDAEEIQIWTDIDGIHNNDPRIVDLTSPVRQLSYREAAELAYFGAKILHPTCVIPAEKMQVPLRLKFTTDPDAAGTIISSEESTLPITAIAAKDNITTINIYSSRMLMAYGFLKKVFQVFEDHKTPVDMITTSEVAVTLTIDDISRLDLIKKDLSDFAEITIKDGYSIICIVGSELYDNSAHVTGIFNSLNDIPLRMVSMGGSRHNISLLIKTAYKTQALHALNQVL
jgi:aspartate kinase